MVALPDFPTPVRVQFVTETIYEGPTATPSSSARQTHDTPVPIAAIVGGAAAGVALALLVVLVWAWWGRCLSRKQAKARKEMRELLAVRENTRRNAGAFLVPGSERYTNPSPKRSRQKRKIRFAGTTPSLDQQSVYSSSEKEPLHSRVPSPSPAPYEKGLPSPPLPTLASSDPPTPSSQRHFLSRVPRTPWGTSVLPSTGPVVLPRPKVVRPEAIAEKVPSNVSWDDSRMSRTSSTMAVDTGHGNSNSNGNGRQIRHMPSAVSSDSAYSTQSGEPRRARERGVLWALRQQLDVNRLSAFSIGSLYSVDERENGEER
ncbi:hypothetical protein PENSPDRAFT_658588 [Peniophora sp. CONT]|nr:hypothetical protein PENSPDRAFT_658588 [Peniophora sp. CONT]